MITGGGKGGDWGGRSFREGERRLMTWVGGGGFGGQRETGTDGGEGMGIRGLRAGRRRWIW